MSFNEKINEEIKDVQIEVKDIANHEWGEVPGVGAEYYKKLVVKFNANDDLLHIKLAFTEDLSEKFCEEINAIWGDDRNPYYKVDLTGFWLEFPKEYDEITLNRIKEIAIKYYLIAKYDKPSYIRRGFDIYEFLGEDKNEWKN